MQRLFISADIEGCAAISANFALNPDGWEWNAARGWMTREVLAVAQSALNNGYDEVIVGDGHGNAHNIDPDALPDGVSLIRSWPRPLLQMQGVEMPDITAAAFVGYHNGVQGKGGNLAHTYHGGAYRDLLINGVSISEGYLNAALAGELGVPVVMVTGDDAAMADAERYAPDAERIAVKSSIGWRSVLSQSPQAACRQIAAGADAAFKRPLPAPFILEGPYVVEYVMTTRNAAEMLDYLPFITQTGPFTVRAEFSTLVEVMRFTSFAMLYIPTGIMAF
jgi:D-amino peptidase